MEFQSEFDDREGGFSLHEKSIGIYVFFFFFFLGCLLINDTCLFSKVRRCFLLELSNRLHLTVINTVAILCVFERRGKHRSRKTAYTQAGWHG